MADTERVKYVEELESQEDYWLSITDAARVCRVQDVSIRRAINSGRLPVRTTNAGDNHRTRFVRASDLVRANFPILDSGAAITSEIRKVDILNIPLQQELLRQQQEAQATTLTHLQEEEEALRTEVMGSLNTLTTTTETQQKQLEPLPARIETQEQRHEQLAEKVQSTQKKQEAQATALTTLQQEQAMMDRRLSELQVIQEQHRVQAERDRQETTRQLEALRTGQQKATDRLNTLTTTTEAQQKQLAPLPARINEQEQRHGQLVEKVEQLEKQTQLFQEKQGRANAELRQGQTDLKASIDTLRREIQEQQRQALKGVQAEFRAALSVARQEIRAELEQQTAQWSQDSEQKLAKLEKRLQTEQAERTTLTERLARYESAQNPSKRKGEPPA